VVDSEQKALVVIIRGTLSVFDCLTDLNGEYEDYAMKDHASGEVLAVGKVHKGIMQGAVNISESVKSHVLEYMAAHPDYRIVITGHSLGGGSTGLLALYWFSDPDIMRYGFQAYALAPPCTNSQEFTPFLKTCCVSCAYGNDIVARASLGAIRDLCEMLLAFERLDVSPSQKQGQHLTAGQIVSKKFYGQPAPTADMLSLYVDIKDHFSTFKLVPPGFIFQIFKKKKLGASKLDLGRREVVECEKYVGAFLRGEFFQEIIFSKTMLSDHMPNLYEQALQLLSGEIAASAEDEEQEELAKLAVQALAPASEETKSED